MSGIVCIAFAKSGGKGRFLSCGIKMAYVCELLHTKYRNSLFTFLGHKGCNGSGQCNKVMPHHHRRTAENMTEYRTLDAVMAKQHNGIVIRLYGFEYSALVNITVSFEQFINTPAKFLYSFSTVPLCIKSVLSHLSGQ